VEVYTETIQTQRWWLGANISEAGIERRGLAAMEINVSEQIMLDNA